MLEFLITFESDCNSGILFCPAILSDSSGGQIKLDGAPYCGLAYVISYLKFVWLIQLSEGR